MEDDFIGFALSESVVDVFDGFEPEFAGILVELEPSFLNSLVGFLDLKVFGTSRMSSTKL